MKEIFPTIPILYGICLALSIALLAGYLKTVREQYIWMKLMLISVCVVNFGYLFLSISPDLTHALMANRIAYLGNVFQPLLMLLVVGNLCRIRIKKSAAVTMIAVASLMFLNACSMGVLPIFYKTVEYAVVDGTVKLFKTYAFLHTVYTAYVISFMVAVVSMTAYSILKKKLVYYRYVVMMVLIAFTNVLVWFVERFARGSFEFLSASYIFTCLLMVMLYSELSENGLIDSYHTVLSVQNESIGVSLDKKPEDTARTPVLIADFSNKETLAKICGYYSANRILSRRETEILALILQGFSRSKIAEELFITDNTVKTHTSNIYSKLAVSCKDELVKRITDDIRSFGT